MTAQAQALREAVARTIIGPRNPVPETCRWTLRELQDIRWKQVSEQERKEALWIADAVIAEHIAPETARADAAEGKLHEVPDCPHCNGTGWVEDEGWSPPFPEAWNDPRVPGNGLIRCGICLGDGKGDPVEAEIAALRAKVKRLRKERDSWCAQAAENAKAADDTARQLTAAKAEIEEKTKALQDIRARTYSDDRGCALAADAVAEIVDIISAALQSPPSASGALNDGGR